MAVLPLPQINRVIAMSFDSFLSDLTLIRFSMVT